MRRLLLFACGLLLFCTACNKEKPTIPDDDSFHANALSATVDGKTFYATGVTASLQSGNFVITGVRNGGNSKAVSIDISIRNYAGLSTYMIDAQTAAAYTDFSGTVAATSGTVTISTDNSEHIKGSFSFEGPSGVNIKSITNGKFDIYK